MSHEFEPYPDIPPKESIPPELPEKDEESIPPQMSEDQESLRIELELKESWLLKPYGLPWISTPQDPPIIGNPLAGFIEDESEWSRCGELMPPMKL